MLPLENVRILDFAHQPPGKFCTMMLGDMGAEVLRVEQPRMSSDSGQSDAATSKWEGLMVGHTDRCFNRNKKSIMLNLRDEEARHIVHRLVEDMDVVVEGFRPGVAARLSIDYQTLASINPRIVHCSLSGYGQQGPYKDMPGHDINYVAVGGALSMFGDPPPVIPNFVADYAGASLHSVVGILLALIARDKTGKGQSVDVSYTDAVVSLMTQFVSSYLMAGDPYPKDSREITFSNAGYGGYKTKDGKYVTLGCVEPWFWQNLCQALGREDFVSEYAKWDRHGEIRIAFADIFLTKTREEWFDYLRGMNIPVGKVSSIEEIFTDAQVLHREMLVEIADSEGRKEKHVGIPIKLSDTPGMIRSPAPVPGQHTEQVLADLGYTKDDLEALYKRGAISA